MGSGSHTGRAAENRVTSQWREERETSTTGIAPGVDGPTFPNAGGCPCKSNRQQDGVNLVVREGGFARRFPTRPVNTTRFREPSGKGFEEQPVRESSVRSITAERLVTARLRYYVYVGPLHQKHRFSVCDAHAERGSKVVGKFSEREHAERFRRMLIGDYVRESSR